MKILVLGCGNIGSAIVMDLTRSIPSAEVAVADNDLRKITRLANRLKGKIRHVLIDASNQEKLTRLFSKFDVVVGALPGRLGFNAMHAAINAGTNMVDVSYTPENPLLLNEDALNAGVTIVPDCGFAPGLTNLIVGFCSCIFDQIDTVKIFVGGLPQRPVPPLGYVITWSVEDLIEEYTRDARIIVDGEIVRVRALDGIETVEIPHVGTLEAFYTDGLRTLLYTMRNVRNMYEKTLRFPGHAEKIKLLRDLGFFDDDKVEVEGVEIPINVFTARVLERRLRVPEVRDMVVMRVEVLGYHQGTKRVMIFDLVDRFDEREEITAMARVTGYMASTVTKILASGEIKQKGIVPPEILGRDTAIFKKIIEDLGKRRIVIRISEK
ncbi:MAG: saccharopine dehydrogenase family protein [Candidatus Baldrarchaeia archaeon]